MNSKGDNNHPLKSRVWHLLCFYLCSLYKEWCYVLKWYWCRLVSVELFLKRVELFSNTGAQKLCQEATLTIHFAISSGTPLKAKLLGVYLGNHTDSMRIIIRGIITVWVVLPLSGDFLPIHFCLTALNGSVSVGIQKISFSAPNLQSLR